MVLPGLTYVGPAADDREMLERVPDDLRRFLEQSNGLVAFDGGLHIRGAATSRCGTRSATSGPAVSRHERYEAVRPVDVPFRQDAVGDQWLLRHGQVVSPASETGSSSPQPELRRVPGGGPGHPGRHARPAAADAVPRRGGKAGARPAPRRPSAVLQRRSPPTASASRRSRRRSPEFLADLARQLPTDGAFRIGFEEA